MLKRTLNLGLAAALVMWNLGCGTSCCHKRPAPAPCGCPPGTGAVPPPGAVIAPAPPPPPVAAGFPPAAYYRP